MIGLLGLVNIWHLLTISFLAGAVEAFDQPARRALFPQLIERKDMMSAVALNSSIWPFFAGLYNVDNPLNKAKEILETLQLDARENELVRNYSRGMKQRVALARALIHEPDILYLDEPFSGLDLLGTSIITNILKNLKAQGKTILMSTHSFDDCADLAERILVLINGEIAFMTSDVNKDHFKQKYLELVSVNN